MPIPPQQKHNPQNTQLNNQHFCLCMLLCLPATVWTKQTFSYVYMNLALSGMIKCQPTQFTNTTTHLTTFFGSLFCSSLAFFDSRPSPLNLLKQSCKWVGFGHQAGTKGQKYWQAMMDPANLHTIPEMIFPLLVGDLGPGWVIHCSLMKMNRHFG